MEELCEWREGLRISYFLLRSHGMSFPCRPSVFYRDLIAHTSQPTRSQICKATGTNSPQSEINGVTESPMNFLPGPRNMNISTSLPNLQIFVRLSIVAGNTLQIAGLAAAFVAPAHARSTHSNSPHIAAPTIIP